MADLHVQVQHLFVQVLLVAGSGWRGTKDIMKLISWNYRGLFGAPTVRPLLDIQRRHSPDVFFLSETHLDDLQADEVNKKLKMDHKIVAPSLDGR